MLVMSKASPTIKPNYIKLNTFDTVAVRQYDCTTLESLFTQILRSYKCRAAGKLAIEFRLSIEQYDFRAQGIFELRISGPIRQPNSFQTLFRNLLGINKASSHIQTPSRYLSESFRHPTDKFQMTKYLPDTLQIPPRHLQIIQTP